MGKRLRLLALALIVGVAWIGIACVSAGLPEGADYQHRYFASLADYNQVKRAILAYVALPDTSSEAADLVVDVVKRTDLRVQSFETLRRSGGAVESDYARIALVLELAANELRARVGE